MLNALMVIVYFVACTNADDWVEMALFAETYQEYFKKYLKMECLPMIPSAV